MSPTAPSVYSNRSGSTFAPSEHSASTGHPTEDHAPPTFFKSIRRAIVKAATAGSEPTHDTSSKGRERSNRVGTSSRGAGVKPKRSATSTDLPLTSDVMLRREQSAHSQASVGMTSGGGFVAGPSRGGFIVQSHAKATPTVATTTGDSTSLADLPPLALPPAGSSSRAVLPPSTVLARLLDLRAHSPSPEAFVPLIRLLARSVSLFPFPPPALAASTLSEVLAATPLSPSRASAAHGTATPLPTPSPAQIYLSQSHHLNEHAPAALRSAMLELMTACVNASLESTGGMRETEKAMFWDEARRWADEARIEVDSGQGGKRWVLPDADREALVGVLTAMTRGGRDLSDVPGLVGLLCLFVTDSLPVPRPPSPLFDPNLATPFIRSVPPKPSPHASSLALLTALHKFCAPHIYTASTLLALRAALEVARLREEQDLGGRDGVLDFLGAVVRFGEVRGGKAAQRRQGKAARGGTAVEAERAELQQDRDEILREVVSTVARIIGCEGLVSVIELPDGRSLRDVGNPPNASAVKTSNLPSQALDLMRDLIRSPANQATKSLRSVLVAPPPPGPDGARPRAPVLLLVGALRSLRKAMAEHASELEATLVSEATGMGGGSSGATGESRWPSMLSLGLPFLWNGIRRSMQWESGPVDAEVLRLVEERLDAAERMALRAKDLAVSHPPAQASGSGGPGGGGGGSSSGGGGGPAPAKEAEDVPKGISFEEWTMAIEVLDKAKKHIGSWEQQNLRQWILSDDGASLSFSFFSCSPLAPSSPSFPFAL